MTRLSSFSLSDPQDAEVEEKCVIYIYNSRIREQNLHAENQGHGGDQDQQLEKHQ